MKSKILKVSNLKKLTRLVMIAALAAILLLGGKFIKQKMNLQNRTEANNSPENEEELFLLISKEKELHSNEKMLREDDDKDATPTTITTTTIATSTTTKQEEQAQGNKIKFKTAKFDFSKCPTSRMVENAGLVKSNTIVQYVHLPKTGGTSIQTSLFRWVTKNNLRYFRTDSNAMVGSSTKCASPVFQSEVFAGHRGYGFCNRSMYDDTRSAFTFTVLRNPLSKLVSHFDYNMENPKVAEHMRYVNTFGTTPLSSWIKKFNATDKLESGEMLIKYLCTQQTRFMCGYECLGPTQIEYDSTLFLQKAMANLKQTDAVGILTERFDNLLTQLKIHLPFVPLTAAKWPNENIGLKSEQKKKSQLDEDAVSILNEWCKTDVVLYETAVILEKRKTNQALECLQRAVLK